VSTAGDPSAPGVPKDRSLLPPKRFLRVCAGTALAVLAVVAAFNALVDPYGEFGTSLVLPDDSDRHSRALKIALLHRAASPPEALILGNSRAMQLSPATVQALTGLRTFNASAAAGSAFDLLAFTRLARDEHLPLQALVVSLDTFMLHAEKPRAELLYFPLVRFLPEFRNPLLPWLSCAARTASVSTAWLSGEQLYYLDHDRARNYAFDGDGRIRYLPYDRWVEDGTWPSPLPDALESVRNQYVTSFNTDPRPSTAAVAALELWLMEATGAGLDVVIFLPPLHSFLSASLARETRYREHFAAYHQVVDRLRQRYRFRFHDLSSVDRFGGADRWFIDGTHMIGPNNDLALKAVLADYPRPRTHLALR
jgi:hypothetical protein